MNASALLGRRFRRYRRRYPAAHLARGARYALLRMDSGTAAPSADPRVRCGIPGIVLVAFVVAVVFESATVVVAVRTQQ